MARPKTTDRRTFLRTAAAGAAAAALPGWLSSCGGGKRRPNVLFIAVDDLNDWANCLGGRPGVHTPNLDRLAARGILFTNAHCTAPACNPSRTSLLTGVRPSTSGIYHNDDHWRESEALQDAVMIPGHFRGQGYRTVGGGKIHHCLSWIRTAYGVDENDFDDWDEYFPSKHRSLPSSVWPEGAEIDEDDTVSWVPLAGPGTEGRPNYFLDWGPLEETDAAKYEDTQTVDWAIREISRRHDRPFFLAAGIFRPHIPWFVPKKYFDLYPLDRVELPPIMDADLDDCSPVGKSFCRREWHKWILAQGNWREAVQAYLASISYADAQLGRLLDGLDRSPHAGNTVIVLWSDHGMHIGEKENWEKFTLWEESTRVPLMFVVPGVTSPGGRCARPVSLLDVYPTLIEACGLADRPGLEGRSLLPLLRNPGAAWDRPALTTHGRGNHAIRSERWRYIRYHDGSEELYDHAADPDEYHNLADRPDLAGVKAELAEWLPALNADPPGRP